MSVKVEKTENKNEVKIEITVGAEEFQKAILDVFNKNKNYFNIPGFRKGKAPYNMVEKVYGVEIFYEDAFNKVAGPAYEEAVKSENLDVVSKPEIDIKQIEKGKDLVFTAVVNTKPEVKLGKYTGLALEKVNKQVKDEEVEAELNQMADRNSRMVSISDKAAVSGNTVNIDYIGTIDGVAFEGGRAENYDLVLGSNTFIPGFEDQVVGMKVDEVKDIKVTFPADYASKEVAGKEANFNVKVHEIKQKELPTIDDEFAKDVSEFDTLKELKADIVAKKEEQYSKDAEKALEDEAIKKAVEVSEVEVPNGMVELEIDNMVEEMNRTFQYQYAGFSFEKYLQMIGQTMADYRAQAKEPALDRVKSRLVLEAIVKDAKIEVTDADVEAKIKEMSEMYGRSVEDINKIDGIVENVKNDLGVEKAIKLLVEKAKVTEVAEKVEEKAEKKTTKKAASKEKEEKEEKAEEKPAKKTTTKKSTKKAE